MKVRPMLRRPTVEFESQPVVVIPGVLGWYYPECLATFPGIFGVIPRNVWRYSPKYLATFAGMFGYIPQNVWGHYPECLAIFPGMFGDIPRNVWGHYPKCLATFPGIKHSPYSPLSVPRSCIPAFIHCHHLG